MKVYVIKETTYEANTLDGSRSVFYWGKPRRLWDSPYYVEGFKTKGAAERAIRLDIERDSLSVPFGDHAKLENGQFLVLYSVEEIEQK